MGDIDFNFTVEQKEKYNIILEETKKQYPHLFKDEIDIHRVQVIIAHNVIFEDDRKMEEKEVDKQEFTEVI
jgi:hypothetical protein